MRQRRINCLAVDAVSGVALAASESINFRHAVASTLCSLTSPVTAVNCRQSGFVEWGKREGYDKRRVVDPIKIGWVIPVQCIETLSIIISHRIFIHLR